MRIIVAALHWVSIVMLPRIFFPVGSWVRDGHMRNVCKI